MLCWVVLSGAALLAVFGTLLFPGLGQGLAAHRWRAIAWAVAAVVSGLLIIVSVWFVLVTFLLRVASAADAYACLRKGARPWQRAHVAVAAVALVIGAIGFGTARAVVEGYKIPTSSMYPTLIIGDLLYADEVTTRWRPVSRGEVIVFSQPCARRPYVKRVVALGGDTVEVRCSVVYINGAAVPSTLVEPRVSYLDHDGRGDWKKYTAARYRETIDGHTFDTFRSIDADQRGDFPARDRMLAPACTQGEFFTERVKQPNGQLVPTKDLATADACEQQLHFVVPKASVFVMGDNRHNANDSRFWGVVPLELVLGRAIGIVASDGPEGGWSRFGAID